MCEAALHSVVVIEADCTQQPGAEPALALALVLVPAPGRQQQASGPTIMKSRHFYPQLQFYPPPGASVHRLLVWQSG